MRQILRQREICADPWRYPGEAGSGPQLVTLAELLAAAPSPPAAAGVYIGPTDEVQRLAGVIDKVALIVVHFEKNGDGRGFSQAQVLRQQLGFHGELRAAGELKRDHLYLLARCGFDAFDLDPSEDRGAALAQLQRFSVAYQRSSGTLVQPRVRT
ncbi:MAG: DUF934 domain-containing protein [Steroidobacteraceae bacterium]